MSVFLHLVVHFSLLWSLQVAKTFKVYSVSCTETNFVVLLKSIVSVTSHFICVRFINLWNFAFLVATSNLLQEIMEDFGKKYVHNDPSFIEFRISAANMLFTVHT